MSLNKFKMNWKEKEQKSNDELMEEVEEKKEVEETKE